MPTSTSFSAKAPYPPLGDFRTSKKFVVKSGGSEIESADALDEKDDAEEEDEDGVRVSGFNETCSWNASREERMGGGLQVG